jgi:hypothetical protein
MNRLQSTCVIKEVVNAGNLHLAGASRTRNADVDPLQPTPKNGNCNECENTRDILLFTRFLIEDRLNKNVKNTFYWDCKLLLMLFLTPGLENWD